jgi:enoyl-CoA hydratase/carnithine racemase
MANLENEVIFEVRDRVAIITLNRPKSLNAMTQHHYFRIAKCLREAAKNEDVVVTVITGRGRFFSA